MPRLTLALAAAVIGLALSLPSAQASRTTGDPETFAGGARTDPMARPARPNEAKLTAFVRAAARIRAVVRNWHAQRGEPQTTAARQALETRARAAVAATADIDAAEYRQIRRAVRADRSLRVRVQAIVVRLRREGRLDPATTESAP